MSTTSNVEYFVTIDSEFRDDEKYPIQTDFAVKFKETSSDIPFVKGVPLNNQYFSPLQIDPNFYNSDFRVLAGTILNLKKLEDNTFIITGLITPTTDHQVFKIQQRVEQNSNFVYQDIVSLDLSTPLFTSVFLCRITLIDTIYVFNWLVYLDRYSSDPSYILNESTHSSFTLDDNNNIYFVFDFSTNFFKLKKKITTGADSLIYDVQNPSTVNNVCMAVFAFDINGNNYYVDGHNWGYHILEGTDDLLPTESNGRLGIKVDNSLSLYVSGNTNPYEPTYYLTPITTTSTEVPVNFFVYKDNSGNDCLLVIIQNGSIGLRANRYSIQSNGLTLLSSDYKTFSTPLLIFINNEFRNIIVQNSLNEAYIIAQNDIAITGSPTYLVSSKVDLITGTLTVDCAPRYLVVGGFGAKAVSAIYNDNIFTFCGINPTGVSMDIGIYRLDTTNLAAGYSLVYTITGAIWSGTNARYNVSLFYRNDIVYFMLNNLWTSDKFNLYKGQLTSTTYTLLQSYQSTSIFIDPVSSPKNGPFFYKDSNYYLIIGCVLFGGLTTKANAKIFNVTDLNNFTEESTLFPVNTTTFTNYVDGSSVYPIDVTGNIFNVTNVENPQLIATDYPILNNDSLTKQLVQTTTQYQQIFGLITDITVSPNTYSILSVPFVDKQSTLNSIHYNQNLENQIDNSAYITFDVVNQISSTPPPQITFNPSNYIGNGLLLWLDSTVSSSVITDPSNNVSEWKDLSGNDYHLNIVGPSDPVYDRANSQILFNNTYLEGSYGTNISPKYMVVVSKFWNENFDIPNSISPLIEIGNSTDKLGIYKYKENYLKSYVSSIPASFQTYNFTSSTNPALTNTGNHPYLFSENYNTDLFTTTSTKYIVGLGGVVFSGTNNIAYAVDGLTWTGNGRTIFNLECRGGAWNDDNSLCVLGGRGGNTLAYSTNGKDFTALGVAIFSSFCLDVAYGNGRWVAVGGGTNTIAYSNDGVNWTGLGSTIFTSYGNSVYYNGSLWVAGGFGTNTLAYSNDGIIWTPSVSGNSVISVSCEAVTYGNGKWIALGDGAVNTLAYSLDGINWIGLGKTLFSTAGYSVGSNPYGRFVAGGDGATNNLAYSDDGINWIGLGKTTFSNQVRGIEWAYNKFLAGGDGTLNSMAYSYDGITWFGIGRIIFDLCYGFVVPKIQSYTEYSAGVFEEIFETQTVDGNTFDGTFYINNENGTPDPVNSTGWNNILSNIKIGKSDLSNPFYRGLVGYSIYTNKPIYVNGGTGNVNNLTGTISEVIMLDFVPNNALRKSIQAYLFQKYNLWNYYSGVNPYKPTSLGCTLAAVNGFNSTLNFIDFSDILNIKEFTLPFSLINSANDPFNLINQPLGRSNVVKLTHLLTSTNIYFFFCFTFQTGVYLLCIQTDLYYSFQQSTYIQLITYSGGPNTVPVGNIIPYEKNGNIYCITQMLLFPQEVRKYKYNTNTLSLVATANINYNNISLPANRYYQTAGEIIQYPGASNLTYLYAFILETSYSPFGPTRGNIVPINITNENQIDILSLPFNLLLGTISATSRYGTSQFKYDNGDIIITARGVQPFPALYEYNVTDPNNITFKTTNIQQWLPIFQYNNTNYPLTLWPLQDNEASNAVFTNPVTKDINYIYNYSNFQMNSLAQTGTPTAVQQSFTFYTLNNSVSPNLIQLTPTNQGYRISLIKYGFVGQKVFAVCLITDRWGLSIQYLKFYDVTNLVYATTYNQTFSTLATPVSTSYNNLNGIGFSFINKISNLGNSDWLSYLGGDNSTIPSLNVNISNFDINPDFSHIYICGGWKNKIETFNTSNTKRNKIYNSGSDYNCFIAKLSLNNGDFDWLLPSIGSNTDYFERLAYIPSKNLIGVVSHFASPVLLIYAPQISSNGPFTNPSDVLTNLSNTSSETSSLIVFTPDGSISFKTLIYTLLELQSIKLYDISVDDSSSKKRIYVVGTTNSTLIRSKDSTGLENQLLYNDINQFTQQSLIVYQYDLDGIYETSQNIIFPASMNIGISDIKSFSLVNRVVVFPNIFSLNANGDIVIYNSDGSYANEILNTEYELNVNQSYIVQYYYDNSFVDVNNITYSRIYMKNGSLLPQTTDELVNYNLFILGSLFDSTTYAITGETLFSGNFPLNNNFSIRSNFVDSNGNYNIILNQQILLKTLTRNNLPYTDGNEIYWSGSVVKSTLSNIIAYDMSLVPNSSNVLTITNVYGININVNNDYYIMIPDGLTTRYIEVLNTTYNTASNTYFMTVADITDLYVDSIAAYYGPYLYLGVKNLNANYILPFFPASISNINKFTIELNSLIIPNRKIKSSQISGFRDINDFRYLILEVFNENDVGDYNPSIINNDFTNDPNYTSAEYRAKATFTIPITNINTDSTGNFVILTSPNIPFINFINNFYNIHITLRDPYGKIVEFDNTPNPNKPNDNVFIGTVIDQSLMQMAANFTLKKAL